MAPDNGDQSEQTHDGVDYWAEDLLGRAPEAEFLISFLEGRVEQRGKAGKPKSFVLNLDAPWGAGKTFFLDRFAKQAADSHPVVRVNAWRDDHADDPLVAVMAALEDSLFESKSISDKAKAAWSKVKTNAGAVMVAGTKGAAKQLATKAFGEGWEKIVDAYEADSLEGVGDAFSESASEEIARLNSEASALINEFRAARNAIGSFKKCLAEALRQIDMGDKTLPAFVLVDELDRCRPPYAIAMLERIKHLFDVDGLVFVIATDSKQLTHAVRAVYGVGFNSDRYLQRFFDRRYTFGPANTSEIVIRELSGENYSDAAISLPPGCSLHGFVSECCNLFDLEPRDVEQVVDLVVSCIGAWRHKARLELTVLLPMVIGLQLGLEPDLSLDFADQLKGFRRIQAGNAEPWLLGFTGEKYSDLKSDRVPLLGLFEGFCQAKATDLVDLFDHRSNSASDAWMRHCFHDEFSREYNNAVVGGRRPYSLILSYPALVQMAGRTL